MKPPLPGEEEGEAVECETPNETPHPQVRRPRRSKSLQQVLNVNKNSKSPGSNCVPLETGKAGLKCSSKVGLCSGKNKRRHKTPRQDSAVRKSAANTAADPPLEGNLLPGVSCSSTGIVAAQPHGQSPAPKASVESSLAALRLEGLMDVLEIQHSPSAGDLLSWDTNVSGNPGGQPKKAAKVIEF
ncbi:unnamed protein product [Hydatigera taeniaeformis]|uniref:Uncharacterized protein n=1 Tax=Hydatigena taeniaeformis TaxID=6205 RepID=A0A3P7F0Q0_HYDTA|nr:unnamed protein product [Hydatigera taeniaeformis]